MSDTVIINRYAFTREPRTGGWLAGFPRNGAGVYRDGKHWYGKVVYEQDLIQVGPYETEEAAMLAADNALAKLRGAP